MNCLSARGELAKEVNLLVSKANRKLSQWTWRSGRGLQPGWRKLELAEGSLRTLQEAPHPCQPTLKGSRNVAKGPDHLLQAKGSHALQLSAQQLSMRRKEGL